MNHKHVIPKGWKRVSLVNLAVIRTGVAKGKKNINNPVALPYLRVANVQDGYLDLNEIKYIDVAKSDVERYSLEVGDVLMTEGGDFDKLGRGFVWNGEIEACLHQNHVFSVRTDKKLLNPYFLSYQAGSGYGKGYFLNCAKQSTNLASINSTQLKEYPVLLPEKNLQDKIVSLIDYWNNSIRLTEELLVKKEKLSNTLKHQLLSGKRRLTKFSKPWSVVTFSDVFERVRRKNTKGNTNVLTISGQQGLVDQQSYYNKSVSGADLSGYTLLRKGEFAYNRSTSNGYPYGAIKRLGLFDEGVVSTLYICFAINNKSVDSDYIQHYFEVGMYNRQIYKVAQEGARSHGLLNVGVGDFFSGELTLPPLDEQKKIASILNVLDTELDLLKQKLTALKRQKQGLMQQLLTGKLKTGG